MRVVQLVTKRQRRGAEVFAAELSAGLVLRGHTVYYAGLNGTPAADAIAPPDAIAEDVSDTASSRLSFRLVSQLGRFLHSREPDVVQANGGYALKYTALAKRWSRGSWPIIYRNIGLSSDWLRRPGQRKWNRWLLRHAEITAAVSQASRTDLLRTYGLSANRVVVVRRGVTVGALDVRDVRRTARAELGVQGQTPLLLHVGSFAPEKNHVGLLRIFERVKAMHADARLVLVGDGALLAEIKSFASRLGGVHVLGVRDDVSRLMAAADLLLLPSLTEGIPGVVLEAGVLSIPAIAYDVGGVSEAIEDKRTGRLIKAGDEELFARAVSESLRNPRQRERFGRSARDLIVSRYSLGASIEKFERLYDWAVCSVGNRTTKHSSSKLGNTIHGSRSSWYGAR